MTTWCVAVPSLALSESLPTVPSLALSAPLLTVGVQAAESKAIQEDIVTLNQFGFLTINSQPAVCGVPSDDPIYGLFVCVWA